MEQLLNVRSHIVCGWMHKKGSTPIPNIKQPLSVLGIGENLWSRTSIKRRFFVLKGADLEYFEDESQTTLLRLIPLSSECSLRISTDKTAPAESYDIVTPGRVYTLHPERGFDLWGFALSNALKSRRTSEATSLHGVPRDLTDEETARLGLSKKESLDSTPGVDVSSKRSSHRHTISAIAQGILKPFIDIRRSSTATGASADSPCAADIEKRERELQEAMKGLRNKRATIDELAEAAIPFHNASKSYKLAKPPMVKNEEGAVSGPDDGAAPLPEEAEGDGRYGRAETLMLDDADLDNLGTSPGDESFVSALKVCRDSRGGAHIATWRSRSKSGTYTNLSFEMGWEIERLCQAYSHVGYRNLSRARYEDNISQVIAPLLEVSLRRITPVGEWGPVQSNFVQTVVEGYRTMYSHTTTFVSRDVELTYNLRPYLTRALSMIPWRTMTVGIVPVGVKVPRLRIVLMTVGSRGDVQPFVAYGKSLKNEGHDVRIATHETFRKFVTGHGLGFYPLAGDPKELMAMMVEHNNMFSPAFISDGLKKRNWIRDLFVTAYEACTCGEDGTPGAWSADALVANPPSMAGIHLAELLNIPFHLAFTMPWSSTRMFQSPFFTSDSGTDNKRNELSYTAVDKLIWMGIRDIVNEWRALHGMRQITVVNQAEGSQINSTRRVPFTYCYSKHLLPKPEDWGVWIDVSGFWFLSNPDTGYEPPTDLLAFLEAGDPPVFVGFGSIVVKDPDALTAMVIEGLVKSGRRGIVQKGWAGGEAKDVPDSIYM